MHNKQAFSIKRQISMTIEDIETKREAIRQIKLQQTAKAAATSAAAAAGDVPTDHSPIKLEPIAAPTPLLNDDNNNIEEEQKYEFLAFARVFSGTLKKGQTLYILSPRHNPEDFINVIQKLYSY
jgi:ribosome assembly protein 1